MSFLNSVFGNNSGYNAVSAAPAAITTQNLQPAIQTANANYGTVNSGLNSLGAALSAQAQGAGPNPAQAQLQQATGQNIQAGTGMIASSKGISPALMTRNVADQTAAANQAAAGQSAVMRANQQLQSQGQLGQVLGEQGTLANTNLGVNQQAQYGQNSNIVSASSAANAQNAATAAANAANNTQMFGSVLNGISGVGSSLISGGGGAAAAAAAKGGEVKSDRVGDNPKIAAVAPKDRFASNLLPNHLKMVHVIFHGDSQPVKMSSGGSAPQPISNEFGQFLSTVQSAATGGPVAQIEPRPVASKDGGTIPGKPMRPGVNDPKQDVVPTMLTPQEVVLPLSVTQSADPVKAAGDFMAKELQKQGKSTSEDFKSAIARGAKKRKGT